MLALGRVRATAESCLAAKWQGGSGPKALLYSAGSRAPSFSTARRMRLHTVGRTQRCGRQNRFLLETWRSPTQRRAADTAGRSEAGGRCAPTEPVREGAGFAARRPGRVRRLVPHSTRMPRRSRRPPASCCPAGPQAHKRHHHQQVKALRPATHLRSAIICAKLGRASRACCQQRSISAT